jgi:sulfotransferase
MSSPVFEMALGLRANMSRFNSYAIQISDDQRERVLRTVVEAFYDESGQPSIVFDTNRGWCSAIPLLARIFPEARIVCCVRNVAWILDSFERLVQHNALQASTMFPQERTYPLTGFDIFANVFDRVNHLMTKHIGGCLNGLRQAWFGEYSSNLIAIRYESFTAEPAKVIRRLYELLGIEHFQHDFERLSYDEPRYDEMIGLPGLHRVRHRLEARKRQTILPPELFNCNGSKSSSA